MFIFGSLLICLVFNIGTTYYRRKAFDPAGIFIKQI